MITQRPELVCALCETGSVQTAHISPHDQREMADFDTRPGEPLRSTMADWVQMCPNCGYCADDISRASGEAQAIVTSAVYQALRHDESVPARARRFLCYSLLLERLHQHGDAGWSALHAAWTCDDAGAEEAAVQCRERAIALWQKGKASGQQFADDLASEFALAADIYRRTGQFEQAIVACSEGLDLEDIPPLLEELLRRQMVLIQRRDTSVHSTAELAARVPAN